MYMRLRNLAALIHVYMPTMCLGFMQVYSLHTPSSLPPPPQTHGALADFMRPRSSSVDSYGRPISPATHSGVAAKDAMIVMTTSPTSMTQSPETMQGQVWGTPSQLAGEGCPGDTAASSLLSMRRRSRSASQTTSSRPSSPLATRPARAVYVCTRP